MYHETLAGSKGRRCQLAKGEKKKERVSSKGNAGTGRLVGYLPVELLKGREGPHRGYRTVGAANSLGYESKKKWQYQHQYHNGLSSEGHLAPGPRPQARLENNVSQAILRPTRTVGLRTQLARR
ncbi:hypothetical protein I7I51_09037 [Histoplasma capsulatum]|uniref:Uncharacterized protein n=1 Tax=Ajellomyces capsulatus TaxID=5037 RepID=A0A8A1M0U7_AJECA|nr:hypothetical protein I7I51_09037 [Histoplasma capsulatum]